MPHLILPIEASIVMATTLSLNGIFPALATPFTADGESIDYKSLESVINYCLEGGVAGVVVAGSTGEAATLSEQEYRELIDYSCKVINGRVPVIVGIGTNNTKRAGEIASFLASSTEADGILLVAPPYNKPTQEGILAHFRAVKSKAADLPIVAYNVPGRTGVNIHPSTIGTLSREGTIIGIKEASGSVDQVLDMIAASGEEFQLVSGDDSLLLAVLSAGGCGGIATAGNIVPHALSEVVARFAEGDMKAARALQYKILPLLRALFVETNPIPLKYSLKVRGIIAHDTLRLPLTPPTETTKRCIESALELAFA